MQRDYDKPLGAAAYRTTKDMSDRVRNALPDTDQLKRLLESGDADPKGLQRISFYSRRSKNMTRILAIILAAALVLILALNARAANVTPDGCCKGIPLCGRVRVVQSFADLKVKVVGSFPDLRVKKVNSFPDKIGEWQFVDSGEDFTIQFVDSFPDIKIQYVDAFPGVR